MPKDARLGIRLTVTQKSLFEIACKLTDRTASEVILEAIENYIDKYLKEESEIE